MKLTPLDIRHKEFKRGMRGYADVEVDEFLDEVADEYERLFKENIDLGERVESLEGQVGGYKRIEETLQKTLISAQANAEELKQNATKEAQLILHEAELKARQLVNDAYSEKQAIEQSMAKLKSAEQDFRFQFRQLLEGYLKQLEETPAVAAAATGAGAAHDGVRPSRRGHQGGHRARGQSAAEAPAPAEAPVARRGGTDAAPPPAAEPDDLGAGVPAGAASRSSGRARSGAPASAEGPHPLRRERRHPQRRRQRGERERVQVVRPSRCARRATA